MVCLNCMMHFRDDDPELAGRLECPSCGCPHFLMDDSYELLKSVTSEEELKTACTMLLERMKSRGIQVWTGLISVKDGKVELTDPVLGFNSRSWDRVGVTAMSFLIVQMLFHYSGLVASVGVAPYWLCFLAVLGNFYVFSRRLANPYRNDFFSWLSTQFMFMAWSIPLLAKAIILLTEGIAA